MGTLDIKQAFWTRREFAILLLMFLAFFFNWPYLLGGFQGDDIILLNLMKSDPLPYSRWQGIWSVNDYAFLDHLWWKDWKEPGDGGMFWRPVPSLVFEGSIHLFGENAFPLHFLSLLLHGGVAVGLYFLVLRLFNRPGLALLAGLFFVACEDHSMGVGWIAAITDLLCVQFILVALLAHIQWLRKRKILALACSLGALIIAMGCKETGSIAPVVIVLLTFFAPDGQARAEFRWRELGERLLRMVKDPLAWLPAIFVLAVYVIMYQSLHLGGFNNLMYINPLANPIGYLERMILHLPVMWLGTFTPVPPYLTMFLPGLLKPLAVVGTIVFIAWLFGLWSFRRGVAVLWALCAYIIALLPQLGADASERGLYLPMVFAAILLAVMAASIGPLARRIVPELPRQSRWTRVMGWVAVCVVLIPGTVLSAFMPWAYLPGLDKPEEDLRTALPYIEQYQPEHILILNTSSFMLTPYTYDVINYISESSQEVWLLSAANGIFSLERSGDSTFIIRMDRAGWLTNMFARIFRTKPNLKLGAKYETPIFTATLEKMTANGKDVLEVSFNLKEPLDYPGWLFLRWNGKAFEPLDISALKLNETVELANTSDLWKSMY
jgi:hypothetical protein